MHELSDFSLQLRALAGGHSVRPFVCDGSPLTCSVFIVGLNPATAMSVDFWEFWSDSTGFDKSRWLDAYRNERSSRPLRAGRTRRSKISPTRRNLDIITESAKPVRCLETNIYSYPTRSAKELKSEHRETEIFDFLMKRIKPALIVTHGVDAERYFREIYTHSTVIFERHLSMGFSHERARELGARIKDKAANKASAC